MCLGFFGFEAISWNLGTVHEHIHSVHEVFLKNHHPGSMLVERERECVFESCLCGGD